MPRPTDPVKRVCYADDVTVWASGVNISDLEVSLNNYLEEITAYLKDNSLLISAPMSSVTLLTPDTHQAKTHPSIFIKNSRLPLVKCPRILGVYLDPSLSFTKNSQYMTERVSCRNNMPHLFVESKPTRHQLQKNPIYTERGSEDRHWLSQDVQYRSPTHRGRDTES